LEGRFVPGGGSPHDLFFDDFEHGAGQWAVPGSMAITDQHAATGTHSQTFAHVASGGDARSDTFAVTPGQTYYLHVDYMTLGGGGYIGIDTFDSSGNYLGEHWLIGDGSDPTPQVWDYNLLHTDSADLGIWKHYVQAYIVPLDVASIRIKDEDWLGGLPNDPVNHG